MNTEHNLARGLKLLNQWLVGAVFVGFRFGSNFTLFFDCDSECDFEGKKLPWQISLDLLESWWLGSEQEWSRKVFRNGTGIEPDEPVKAFELAKLRWSEGARIESIMADRNKLSLFFENGTILHALLNGEDEFLYSIREHTENTQNGDWSLTLDEEGFHIKTL